MSRYRWSLFALALIAAAATACGSDVDGNATAPLATVVAGNQDHTEITAVPSSPRSTVTSTSPTPTTTAPTTTPSSTTAPSTPSTPQPTSSVPAAAPDSYLGDQPGFYYFSTPSGKFECGVVVTESSVAGCHGSFPSDVPEVQGSGAPNSTVPPNTIELTAGSPARFLSSGDPRFHRFDGTARELPYGTLLPIAGSGSSNGLTCRVDEKSGVSCQDGVGHGFTVSDTAYDLH